MLKIKILSKIVDKKINDKIKKIKDTVTIQ